MASKPGKKAISTASGDQAGGQTILKRLHQTLYCFATHILWHLDAMNMYLHFCQAGSGRITAAKGLLTESTQVDHILTTLPPSSESLVRTP